jgi:hypothetical protein
MNSADAEKEEQYRSRGASVCASFDDLAQDFCSSRLRDMPASSRKFTTSPRHRCTRRIETELEAGCSNRHATPATKLDENCSTTHIIHLKFHLISVHLTRSKVMLTCQTKLCKVPWPHHAQPSIAPPARIQQRGSLLRHLETTTEDSRKLRARALMTKLYIPMHFRNS